MIYRVATDSGPPYTITYVCSCQCYRKERVLQILGPVPPTCLILVAKSPWTDWLRLDRMLIVEQNFDKSQ